MKKTNYSSINTITVGEFLDIYSVELQNLIQNRLHYYVSNGKILYDIIFPREETQYET